MNRLASSYGYAARRPFAILILVVAILAGMTVALWLLPLGLLAYAAIVYVGARTLPPPPAIPRMARPRITSAVFRSQITTIERAQQAIERSVAQAGSPLARLLRPVVQQARDLVDDSYLLAEKGQIIEQYLASVDLVAIDADIQSLNRQLATTSDSYTHDQLIQTRTARQEKLANAADLQQFIERIQAQLRNIAATLDNILAETVRLRTADAVSADAATNQVAIRLRDLKSDMDAFQRVLDTALHHTHTP
ncbi:MAG TPA: hypothetical protein PKA05_05055 [Roseiflexaceae bacterium]|nr:hypothetical protein [Roseiflexaceae bacterium]HMP39730.1 hypothetical protein [Roseiflexaceae bacterium]